MARVILQVLPALGAGGVEQGTIDIAKTLVDQGDVALVASGGGFRVAELEDCGARHICLPLATKNPFKMWGANVRALKKIIQEEKVDLVHARSRAPAWSAYLACRQTGVPFMTTFHGTYNFGGWAKKFYNSVMVRGVRVIAISDFIRDHILAHYTPWVSKEGLQVIPRGIDLTRFDPEAVSREAVEALRASWQIPRTAPVLLMPGRLTRWKGHESALRAFARLKRGSCYLVMIGDSQGRQTYENELKTLSQDLKLQEFVRFVPHSGDMPLVYAACDGVIHAATDPEAFGRVVAEAQAMGKPCLVSDLGAPKEIIEEGVTGWSFPAGDVFALAHGMETLLALKKEARARLGDQARLRVKTHFSLEQMGAKTLELYHEVLQGK